jgi:glycosyltransferase involved in cell wall biosynthesis
MTAQAPLVGLLYTQGMLRQAQQHPCGLGPYGIQFLQALAKHPDQCPNIRLIADHPDTQRQCVDQLNLSPQRPSLPWMDLAQSSGLDILHSFEPSPLNWVQQRGRAPHRSLILSSTLDQWHAASMQTYVLENFNTHDLLFCASHAAAASVKRLWKLETAKLQRRFGALRQAPRLPQIQAISAGLPLNPAPFTDTDRIAARTTLKIGSDDIVIVQAGRVDAAQGFDPTVLYRVVAEVQKRIATRVQIVDCCSFSDDSAKQAADRTARDLGLLIRRADINRPDYLLRCLAAADIYAGLQLSLHMGFDNLHLQAMDAGLACVLSDWGAHRDDLATHQSGFLVPTYITHKSSLPTRLQNHAASWSELACVDFEQAVAAIETLCTDSSLRQSMGQHAQKQARDTHHWKSVLARYQACWAQQHQKLQHNQRPAKSGDPAQAALSDLYRPFASGMLTPVSRFKAQLGVGEGHLKTRISHLVTHKAPMHHTLPKEQQAAIYKDSQSMVQWLDAQAPMGATASEAAQAIGRSPGQRLADLARLTRLGLATSEPQDSRNLKRPLTLMHDKTATDWLQRLESDRRIRCAGHSGQIRDELMAAHAKGSHFLWLAPQMQTQDYWLYERLQDAFAQYAIVVPASPDFDQRPPAEPSNLPWLAVRHDAIEWLLQGFADSKPDALQATNVNPWAGWLQVSKIEAAGKSIGHWPIDIGCSEDKA